MGFMDDIKKAAKEMGEGAKKAAAQGKEKVGELQTRKQMDDAAKKLGYLIHRERTENVPAGAEADQMIADISRLQQELAAAPVADPSETPPPDPGGDTP